MGLAALGELARELLPDARALAGEVEGDVRLAALPRAVVEVLLGVLDLVAVEDGLVGEDEVLRARRALGVALLGADDREALGHGDDAGRVELHALVLGLALEVGAALVGAGQDLLGLLSTR